MGEYAMDDCTGSTFLDTAKALFPDFFLLESLPIGLVVVDAGAHIISVNDYVEQMLGFDRDELLGQSVAVSVFVEAAFPRVIGLGKIG